MILTIILWIQLIGIAQLNNLQICAIRTTIKCCPDKLKNKINSLNMKYISTFLPLFYFIILFNSCTKNPNKPNTKLDKNDIILNVERNSFWYWINEKYCFPQQNYCIDSFYFHFDSISGNITDENFDKYIPDLINKLYRIKNIYKVNINNNNNKIILPQFIAMYNVISYLKKNKYVLKSNVIQKKKYLDSFPVKISYFFSYNQQIPITIKDTFFIKNNIGIIGGKDTKVIGELKINKFNDDYLKNIDISKVIYRDNKKNTYHFYNKNKTFDVELSVKPFDNISYITL